MHELKGIRSIKSAKLFLQSSELGLPHLLAGGRLCPPPLVWGGGGSVHTRLPAREWGWGSPNSDKGTDTLVLLVYMYFVRERLG
jgi:hypothetical protein